MRAIMESSFDIAYLVTVISLGMIMIIKSGNNGQKRLFGLMALILGCGDAFHLVPRMYGLLADTMDTNAAALGFGKLITSVTMTIFYVLLYLFYCNRYNKPVKSGLSAAVLALATARIALCLFPQNDWLSAYAPVSWGLYRNIPFVILGILIVYLFFSHEREKKDKSFKWAWLSILLSFLFYIPVVLWADNLPVIGMLMIPKTVCYVWLVVIGYHSFRQ